jgi:hypothetical protein
MAENPGEWASGALLDGDPGDPCLWMGGPVTRGELASLVDASGCRHHWSTWPCCWRPGVSEHR